MHSWKYLQEVGRVEKRQQVNPEPRKEETATQRGGNHSAKVPLLERVEPLNLEPCGLYPQQLPYRVGTSIRGKTQVSACRCHTGYGGDSLNTHPHGRAQKTPAHKAMSSQGLFPAGIAALALQSMETRPVRCSQAKTLAGHV